MIWRDNQEMMLFFVWAILWVPVITSSYTAPKMIQHPEDTMGVVGEKMVLSCRATSDPAPIYTWSKNTRELSVTGTRIRVSDGDLIFDKFTKGDVGDYQCVVRSKTPTFELKLISEVAKVITSATPQKFHKDIQPVTAYVGGTMRFAVDVSNFVPSPQVSWNYKGNPTITSGDPRFFVLPNGVLQVTGLTLQENGELRAVVRPPNVGGVKTGGVVFGTFQKIDVVPASSRPASKGFYFLAQPQNIGLKWGQSIVLEALADSANPVTYTWHKDGQLVQVGGAKSIVGQGNLKILYATEEDAGDYRVVVSSGGETLEATATINFMSLPKFTAKPPSKVYGVESQSVKFDFKLLGNPKPKVVWYHDGVIVNAAADYAVFGGDYLKLHDLIIADHGMYQAFAVNALGMAEIELELIITPHGITTAPALATTKPSFGALIPSSPRNVNANPISSNQIAVSWQEPSITNGQIQYYQLFYSSPNAVERSETISASLRSFTLDNLEPATMHTIQLQANNLNGKSPRSVAVTALTPNTVQTPGVVQDLQHQIHGNTLKLTWNKPISGQRVTVYKVALKDDKTSDMKEALVNSPTTSYEFPVTPKNSYTYFVVPMVGSVEGAKSDEISIVVPEASNLKPPAPQNLRSISVGETAFRVKWDAVPTSSFGGILAGYQIIYNEQKKPNDERSINNIQVAEVEKTIVDLKPNTKYDVTIQAVGEWSNTLSDPSNKITVATLDPSASGTARPGPVQSMWVLSKDGDSISLQWSFPKGTILPSSFLVVYKSLDDPSQPEQTFTSKSPSATLGNLKPLTSYQLYVVGVANGNKGNKSRSITVRTSGEVPPAPKNLRSSWIGIAAVKVKWDPVSYESFRGRLNGYQVQYNLNQKGSEPMFINNIEHTDTEVKIGGLKRTTKYDVIVRAIGSNGMASLSLPSNLITVETVDYTSSGPSPPKNFRLINHPDYPSNLMLSWEPPLFHTGAVKNYLLFYRPENVPLWHYRKLPGSFLSYNTTNFMHGVKYVGYVSAVDDNGRGSDTRQKTVTTLTEDLPPPPPVSLVLTTNADSVAARWEPPSFQSPIVVLGYNVTVKNTNKDIAVFKGTLYGRNSNYLKTYNNIEPKTEYSITVTSFNRVGSSTTAYAAGITVKAPISALLVTKVDAKPRQIFFKWNDTKIPSGTEYIIRYDVMDEEKFLRTNKQEATLSYLTPYTPYQFYVKRKNDAAYPKLPTVDAKTLEAPPSAPLNVRSFGSPDDPTWLLLSWNIPRYPHGIIQKYTLYYSHDKDKRINEWETMETKGPTLIQNVTGLAENTKYYFRVRATNGAGSGDLSTIHGGDTPLSGIVAASPGGDSYDWWWWWILLLLLLLLLLLCCCFWCCYYCCWGVCIRCCLGFCPCCEGCWYRCCFPFLLFCCPCCCKKSKKKEDSKAFEVDGGGAGGEVGEEIIELSPLLSSPSSYSGFSPSRRTSKSSVTGIKVPTPGDVTFISYKTSLQDYCQKAGWLAPIYASSQYDEGYHSKVAFGGSSYDGGDDLDISKQDAEQRAAFMALVGLGCINSASLYSGDASIIVPAAGDASFISYKCSLHDFCQQCNILPPRFITSNHDSGYSSSVQVGSHTFNMSTRVNTSYESEQKVACIALQGLCMMDSQAGYFPEACFTVAGPGDPNFVSFKSSLHDFCQKYKLPPPQYITSQGAQGSSAKLKFGGLFFQSSNHFASRQHAEQHAAFEALQGLGLLESAVEFTTMPGQGGNLLSSRGTSNAGSRQGSRPGSRQGSRHPSRNNSRHGSYTHLDQVDSARVYGYDGYNGLQSNGSAVSHTNYINQRGNSYQEDNRNVSSSTLPHRHNKSGSFSENQLLITGHSTIPRHHHHHHSRSGSIGESRHLLTGSSTLPHQSTMGMESHHQATSSVCMECHNTQNCIAERQTCPLYVGSPPESIIGSTVECHHAQNNYIEGDTPGPFPVLTAKYNPPSQNEKDQITFTYSNGTGTFPRSLSVDHRDGGIGSQYDSLSQSSGYATMPKNGFAVGNSTAYSQQNQYVANQHQSYSARNYSSSHNIHSPYHYDEQPTKYLKTSTSHPALPDIEKEMESLEGLIKDLNGITMA